MLSLGDFKGDVRKSGAVTAYDGDMIEGQQGLRGRGHSVRTGAGRRALKDKKRRA